MVFLTVAHAGARNFTIRLGFINLNKRQWFLHAVNDHPSISLPTAGSRPVFQRWKMHFIPVPAAGIFIA